MKLLFLAGLMWLCPLIAVGQINPSSVYFEDVPIGTTDSAEFEITVKGSVGTYSFEIEGEGFSAPATFDANFGLNKNYSRGNVWVYFTPIRAGFHRGRISVDSFHAGLYGTSDSVVAAIQSRVQEHVIARLIEGKVVLSNALAAGLTIVDLIGRRIVSTQIVNDYDLSRLSKGVYIVKISQGLHQQSFVYRMR